MSIGDRGLVTEVIQTVEPVSLMMSSEIADA
jgi:hypothetical protein